MRYDRTTRPSRPRTPPSAGCVTAAASASTSECAALDHPLSHSHSLSLPLSLICAHTPPRTYWSSVKLLFLQIFVFVVIVVERDVSLLLLLRLLLRHLLIFILLLLVSLLPPLPLPLPLLPLLVLLLPGSYGSSPSYDTTLSPTIHRLSRPCCV